LAVAAVEVVEMEVMVEVEVMAEVVEAEVEEDLEQFEHNLRPDHLLFQYS
jgi:hypothetical protein